MALSMANTQMNPARLTFGGRATLATRPAKSQRSNACTASKVPRLSFPTEICLCSCPCLGGQRRSCFRQACLPSEGPKGQCLQAHLAHLSALLMLLWNCDLSSRTPRRLAAGTLWGVGKVHRSCDCCTDRPFADCRCFLTTAKWNILQIMPEKLDVVSARKWDCRIQMLTHAFDNKFQVVYCVAKPSDQSWHWHAGSSLAAQPRFGIANEQNFQQQSRETFNKTGNLPL